MMIFATTTELMAHQREAAARLLPSRVGALFMDMGTGKSRTAIQLAAARAAAGKIDRVVWAAPVSVKTKIAAEIIKHTDTPPARIHVFDDKTTDAELPKADWYVIGLESIGQSTRVTLALARLLDERTMLIVDESDRIKNDRALRSRRLTLLGDRARYRLILTGTPTTQGVEDLYSQMKFLSPNILGYRSWWAFRTYHLVYSERYPGRVVATHNTAYLAARMAPYVYQVRRDECVDLPLKINVSRTCPMSAEQTAAYEAAKERFFNTPVEGWDRLAVFRLFTALQTIVCGFVTVGDRCDLLREHRVAATISVVAETPDDEKIIIWSRWRRSVAMIVRSARERWGHDAVAEMHGGIPERDRDREIERWRREARILVATQSTGGLGIDLCEGRTVIFHSDSYKYSERIQAEDRSHRIGQTQRVTYVTVRTDAGIDERIARALSRKENALNTLRAEIDAAKGRGREAAHKLMRSL